MPIEHTSRGRNGSAKAPDLLARLSEPAFRERVQVSEADMLTLDRIASGAYVRNAGPIISAIKLKIEAAYSKQVQPVEVIDQRVQVEFPGGRAAADHIPPVPASRPN